MGSRVARLHVNPFPELCSSAGVISYILLILVSFQIFSSLPDVPALIWTMSRAFLTPSLTESWDLKDPLSTAWLPVSTCCYRIRPQRFKISMRCQSLKLTSMIYLIFLFLSCWNLDWSSPSSSFHRQRLSNFWRLPSTMVLLLVFWR